MDVEEMLGGEGTLEGSHKMEVEEEETEDDDEEESSPSPSYHESYPDAVAGGTRTTTSSPPPEPWKVNWCELPLPEWQREYGMLTLSLPTFEENLRKQVAKRGEDPYDDAFAAGVLLAKIKTLLENYPGMETIVDRYGYSILTFVCKYISAPVAEPSIRYLVAKNPHALLWFDCYTEDDIHGMPLWIIVQNHHPNLIFWILQEYRWVFDLDQYHVHVNLVARYRSGDGAISLETVQSFYEEYPEGLAQQGYSDSVGIIEADDRQSPVRLLLERFEGIEGWTQSDQELLEWMVELCPESIHPCKFENWGTDMAGNQLGDISGLQYLCSILMSEQRESCNVAQFLLSKYPAAAKTKDPREKQIPLFKIRSQCNNTHVQDLAIKMIRYCYDEDECSTAFEFPFYKSIHHCLGNEMKVKDELLTLRLACGKTSTIHECNSHLGKLYLDWALDRMKMSPSTLKRARHQDPKKGIPFVKRMFEQDEELAVGQDDGHGEN